MADKDEVQRLWSVAANRQPSDDGYVAQLVSKDTGMGATAAAERVANVKSQMLAAQANEASEEGMHEGLLVAPCGQGSVVPGDEILRESGPQDQWSACRQTNAWRWVKFSHRRPNAWLLQNGVSTYLLIG